MKTLLLFSLAVSVAVAAPSETSVSGVISHDNTGVVVQASLVQHYSKLCQMFPEIGDKEGDGVFVIDSDTFHLDAKYYQDYLTMLSREQASTRPASTKLQTSATKASPAGTSG